MSSEEIFEYATTTTLVDKVTVVTLQEGTTHIGYFMGTNPILSKSKNIWEFQSFQKGSLQIDGKDIINIKIEDHPKIKLQ